MFRYKAQDLKGNSEMEQQMILNEAIIGNKNILATYTQKGEMLQRLYVFQVKTTSNI